MTPRQYVGLRISNDAEAVPTSNDIDEGELAINLASERIYMRFGEQVRDITDRYTRSEIDQLLAGKADATHGHDWDEISGKPAMGSAAGADVADFDPAGTAANEANAVRQQVERMPDPLLMHFL